MLPTSIVLGNMRVLLLLKPEEVLGMKEVSGSTLCGVDEIADGNTLDRSNVFNPVEDILAVMRTGDPTDPNEDIL